MKTGYALLIAMSYQETYTPLNSAYPSADGILQSFKRKKNRPYFPEWKFHTDEPITAITKRKLKTSISEAADLADQSGKDLLMIYVIGHGYGIEGEEIFILSDDSDYPDEVPFSGISVSDLIDIVVRSKFNRNVVFILDVCRNQELTKIASRDNLHQMLQRKSTAFESLLIVCSTTHGSEALGGSEKINKSPYSIALSKFIENDNFLAHPRTGIEKIFKEILTQIFNENDGELRHKNISAYPYSVNGKDYTFFAFPLKINLFGVKKKIIEREKKSFNKDYFLSSFEEIWNPSFKTTNQKDFSIENIIYDTRPIIITAQSGYGKTIAGKYLSVIANEKKGKNVWIYFNILNLNTYKYDDLHKIIYKNISLWRYRIDDFISHESILSFINENSFVIVLDFIDDFYNDKILNKFIHDIYRLGIRIIILCQQDKIESIKRLIADPSVVELILQPYSINSNSDIELIRRVRINEKLNLPGDPISIHNVLRFIRKENKDPETISEVDYFIYNEISDIIFKFKNNFNNIDFNPDYDILKDKYLFSGDKFSTYILYLISNLSYFLYKRNKSFSFKEHDVKSFLRKTHPEADIEHLLTTLLKILLESKTLRQDGGRGTRIRFSHNTNTYRLIALYYYYSHDKLNKIIQKSKETKWTYIVAKYFSTFDCDEVDFHQLCAENPFCAAQAIQFGYKFSELTLKKVVNELLKNSSVWTRNKASATLGILPDIVKKDLLKLFPNLSIEQQNTVVLSLGYQTDGNSVAMLKEIYSYLLDHDMNSDIHYLRRRTLDSLKGKLDIDFIKKNNIHKKVEENEWARVLKAIASISKKGDDFSLLTDWTSRICKSDLSIELLNNTYLEKLALPENSDLLKNIDEKKILSTVKKALSSDLKWHKCIAVLFLEEVYLTESSIYNDLSDLLLNRFLSEENLQVKGDIAYIYGLYPTEQGIEQIIREYAKEEKNKASNEDLLNDMALGISRAVYLNRDFYRKLTDFGLEHIYKKNIVEFNG